MAEPPSIVVVREFLAALSGDDPEAALTCLDEEVYFVTPGNEPWPSAGDFSGHDGFRRWWEREKNRSKQVVPLGIEQLDSSHVFAEVHIGTVAGSDSWMSVGIGVVFTIEGGRIKSLEMFTDAEQAAARVLEGNRFLDLEASGRI